MSDEITLRAEVPDVTETAIRIEVRCGETTCDVYEHGHHGSGDWAAWVGGGHIVGPGGVRGYTKEQALNDARKHVQNEERRRLFHARLKAAL